MNCPLVNVFVPTTPNPTSGFYLLVPPEVSPLNMTMEEALKLITSGGLITPDDKSTEIMANKKAGRRGADRLYQPAGAAQLLHRRDLRGRLVLVGSEVKSLRDGKANLKDSYARIQKGEAFLVNAHISPYPGANQFNHEPTRTRKLLLHPRDRTAYRQDQGTRADPDSVETLFQEWQSKGRVGTGTRQKALR